MAENGWQLEQQVAAIATLLDSVQADFDRLAATPAANPAAAAECARGAAARLAERRAQLTPLIATLQQDQARCDAERREEAATLANREDALQASREQLRALTRRLVRVQEDERRSLARDLHDTSGQAMTILSLGLSMLAREAGCSEHTQARIAELRQMAESVGEDLHRLSVNLRPSSLDRYGLVPALDELVRTMRKQAGIEVEFRAEGLEERLPADTETALYRIVQEACTNIVRSAEAGRAVVSLRRVGDDVEVWVEDDGRGFDVEAALGLGRLGLLGMRERAEMLGGTFEIDSRPGHGTVVRVRTPAHGAVGGDALAVEAGSAPEGDDNQVKAQEDAGFDPSEAAELVRAKALSDTLVDIVAGMTGNTTADEAVALALGRATYAIGCDAGLIMTPEAGGWRVESGYRMPLVGELFAESEVPACLWVERNRSVFVANDAFTDPVVGPEIAARQGIRSMIMAPLFVGHELHGVLSFVYYSCAIPFKPSEVGFVERLAGLVSLSVQNKRLREREQQQKALLEAVFAAVPVALAVLTGGEYRYVLANAAFRRATPNPELDPIGRRYSEIWPPEEGFDPRAPWLADLLATGQPFDMPRHRRVFRDGSEHFFDYHVRRLVWNGEPAALVVLAETTATEQAAAQARAAAQALDAILSSISDGLVVYGREGQIERLNEAAQAILGYSAGEADRPFSARAQSLQPLTVDGRPYALEELSGPRALRGETVRGTVMALQQPGGLTWVSASSAPLYGPDGELRGAVSTFTDITAQRAAQENLQVLSEELAAANHELRAQAQELQHLNARLADERDRLSVLLANLPDEVWFCDAAGNVAAANPAAVRGVGLSDTGEAFQPFPDWTTLVQLNPDGQVRPPEQMPLMRVLRGEQVLRQEEIIRNLQTGEWRYREASGAAIRDDGGMITGGVLVVRDLTEYKQAEAARLAAQAALAESESRYRQLFTAMDDSFMLLRPVYDAAGQLHDWLILEVNPAAAHRSGVEPEALMGKTLHQLNPDVPPERLALYESVLRTGQPLRHSHRAMLSEAWYELYAYRPAPELLVLLGHDVTERHRNEEANRRTQAIYRAVAHSFPNGAIYVFDPDLRYVLVDGEALDVFRQTAREMEGKTIWEALDEETVAMIEPRYRRVLAGESLHYETQFGPQYDRRIVSADYRPILDPDGQVLAGLLVAQDITEREQLVVELRKTVAELDGVLAALPSGLMVYDAEGRIVRVNALAQDMLGYDEAQWSLPVGERVSHSVLAYRPDGTVYAHEDYPALRALRGERVSEDVFLHLPHAPERDFWCILSAWPVEGDGGLRLGAVITMTDTSEIHRVGEELTHANARLREQAQGLREAAELLEQRVASRTAELASKTERLEFLRELDSAILARVAPAEIAQAALEKIRQTTGAVRGTLAVFDAAAGTAEILASIGAARPGGAGGDWAPLADFPMIDAVAAGEFAAIEDLAAYADGDPVVNRDLLAAGIRSLAVVPLSVEGRVIGGLVLGRGEPGPFSEDALQLISHLAGSLAIAINNARLAEQVRVSQVQLRALSRRLVEAQEHERSYVADQLYNQAAQVLAALKLQLWTLDKRSHCPESEQQMAEMKSALDKSIHLLHDLASQLRPAGLDRLSLADLLHDYVARSLAAERIAARYDAGDAADLRPPVDVATAVFRTVQEAVSNIVQHSHATEANLILRTNGSSLTVTVGDNGVGFDVAAKTRKGVGLIAMRERVESVGGRLNVKSSAKGTTISISVPLPAGAGDDPPAIGQDNL